MSMQLISSTPNLNRCIFISSPYSIQSDLGVSFKLVYPSYPFVFFCGSKRNPSDLHISIKWKGKWLYKINNISMNIELGKLKIEPIILSNILQTNKIETVIKLNSGYELRPVIFSITLKINIITNDNNIQDIIIPITNAHCVLMTAPSTQKKKALGSLAWQELKPFLELKTLQKSKNQYFCHKSQLLDLLKGRWNDIFENKHPFPSDFGLLLNDLSKKSFFKSYLSFNRQNATEFIDIIGEKEFKKIWCWYESCFSFIEEYPGLFFNLNIPKIETRKQCETNLQQFPHKRRTFSIRFASEDSRICISAFKNSARLTHAGLMFKRISELGDYVKLLEHNNFWFVDSILTDQQPLYPKLCKYSIFTKQQGPSAYNYTAPVASISQALTDKIPDKNQDSLGLNNQNTNTNNTNNVSNSTTSNTFNTSDIKSWKPSDVANFFHKKGFHNSILFSQYKISGKQLNTNFLTHTLLSKMGFPPFEIDCILREISILHSNINSNSNNNINISNINSIPSSIDISKTLNSFSDSSFLDNSPFNINSYNNSEYNSDYPPFKKQKISEYDELRLSDATNQLFEQMLSPNFFFDDINTNDLSQSSNMNILNPEEADLSFLDVKNENITKSPSPIFGNNQQQETVPLKDFLIKKQ